MSGSKKVTIGHKYRLGIHMVFGHGPFDSVDRIDVDKKPVATGNFTGGPIVIRAPNHFGGEEQEGGIEGTVSLEMGKADQGRNSYLQSQLGEDIPAFRGVVGLVLNRVYIGMTKYVRPWSIWATRIQTRTSGQPQWYPSRANVQGDMNPAHIIRECLTDTEWGMGHPEGEIDETSFRTAADIMHSEGMGLSLLWDRSKSLEDFVMDILRHIQGSLFISRSSGKFMLRLARGGYNVESLPVLDENSVSRVGEFKRLLPGDLYNSVTVVFWDRNTGNDNSITSQDIALIGQMGTTIGTTKQFPGITRGDLAARVCDRELRALSAPLASATLYATRHAASLDIGDEFVLNWPRLGVTQMVMRVTGMELGSLDSNLIKVSCIEDVFSMDSNSSQVPRVSEWVDPVGLPVPSTNPVWYEAPYWELAQSLGDASAAALDPTSTYVCLTAKAPPVFSDSARVAVSPDGSSWEVLNTPLGYCSFTTTSIEVGRDTTTIPLSAMPGDDIEIGEYALLGNEAVVLRSVGTDFITVGRGCLDTVPQSWPEGTPISFPEGSVVTLNREYAPGERAYLKILPVTGKGMLSVSSSPQLLLDTLGRHHRPYPPARVRINSQSDISTLAATSSLALTWVHRNRLTQTSSLVDTQSPGVNLETGTTYVAEVRRSNGSLITSRNFTGNTGTIEPSDLGANYGVMVLTLHSVRDGYPSWQKHSFTFTRDNP